MRAAEFVTERKKRKRKRSNKYFGGYWYPGYGYYGSSAYGGESGDSGGGDGGGGESVTEAKNSDVIYIGDDVAIVGQEHGKQLQLSDQDAARVRDIAQRHGAWYEGNGMDQKLTRDIIDRYQGSWDDDLLSPAVKGYPAAFLYVLFSNIKENDTVEGKIGSDPESTIFDRILSTQPSTNYFPDRQFDAKTLTKFLRSASEGPYDFVRMSQAPATERNVRQFFTLGERLMFPDNWEEYPYRAGRVAKSVNDLRDKFLATRKRGVYVAGSDHLRAVQQFLDQNKQGVAEGGGDGGGGESINKVTKKMIHDLADRRGIAWDNEPDFLRMTEKLTGHKHLDDLDAAQLRQVYNHIQGQQGVAEDRENYNGVNILFQKDDDEIFVKASAGGRELGHVLFVIDGEYLMPQDLEVEERYRGQGIAQTMYDFVKSKGYKIRRSGQQTDAGAGFWDKHKGQGQNVWESFDRPYAIDWEDSEYGDIDALATLDDGTHLSIMFNQESGHDGRRPSHWSVEFYRNNSQEVTGEGDAQKIFATVLSAIQQFIKKENPGSISFSASKEPEVDMIQPGANANPESRAKLYNRLVQRYASSMGYSVQQQEGNGKVTYTLRQAKPGVAENFADGKVKGKSRPGRVKRAGASCSGSVTDLRKRAKNASGEKAKMYHWCANMKGGKK